MIKKNRKKIRIIEVVLEKIMSIIAFTSFIFIFLIILFIFREAIPLVIGKAVDEIGYVSVKKLLDVEWFPVSNTPRYGIIPLMIGSLKVTLIAIGVAFPISVLAALYTATLAPRNVKEIVKPAIEMLAGFPSVVIGFFALMVMASFFQQTLGIKYRLNAFTGGVALSLAIIPIIYTVTEESLNSLPSSFTEASLALGATKWETTLYVLLPASVNGIFASVLLGIGRAFGETMIVLMATGNSALISPDIFEPVRTMSATIGAEMAEVVFGDAHYNILFFIGVCLFVIAFVLNMIAELFVKRLIVKKFRGKT